MVVLQSILPGICFRQNIIKSSDVYYTINHHLWKDYRIYEKLFQNLTIHAKIDEKSIINSGYILKLLIINSHSKTFGGSLFRNLNIILHTSLTYGLVGILYSGGDITLFRQSEK